MKKKFLLLPGCMVFSILMFYDISNNPAPEINWQKCIGGTKEDYFLYLIQLRDGNFLYCGATESRNGDFNRQPGQSGSDAFLLKVDDAGKVIWKKTYGGTRDDVFYNVIEAANGDIIAIGTSGSNDQQVTNHHGVPGVDDIWLVKTDSTGQLIKERCYGGSKSESTFELGMSEGLLIDKNGNILFVGQTSSNDGDVSGNHGDYDGWIVKIDPVTFNIINSKTIGDAAYDAAYNIYEINGALFVTGCKSTVPLLTTNDSTVEDHGDGFATKLDATTFNTIWYKSYGGSRSEYINASVVTQDKNLVLSGHAASSDGDCVGNQGFNTWAIKINADDGSIIWKNFTGSAAGDTSSAFNMTATQDGGFALAGILVSSSDPLLPDGYIVRLNSNGDTLWTKRIGGSSVDYFLGVVEKNDSRILVGGQTYSPNLPGFHVGPFTPQKSHVFPGKKKNGPASDAWMVEIK
jgi:hypothetical protein